MLLTNYHLFQLMTVFRSRRRTRLFQPSAIRFQPKGDGNEQSTLLALGLIWVLSTLNDILWGRLDRSVPSWDPAKHLISALDYWAALQHPHFFSGEWWNNFWMLSPKYPPLTYIVTAPFLAIFGRGTAQALLVNVLFTAILMGAVYGLGKRLHSAEVGVWAAGLCIVLPRLYDTRTIYLIDYPLMALVALSFYCLTVWRDTKIQRDQWLWILGFGVAFGLAMLTKQTALLFLLVPLLWVGVAALWQRQWERLAQLVTSLVVAAIVFMPWYRTNWIFIASASQNANTIPAMQEGDPPLNTLGAWIFYWKDLPNAVSWPLLLVAIVGLLLYWSQLFTSFREEPRSRQLARKQNQNATLRWFALFCGSSYLFFSAVVNKDLRYIMPYLPVVAVVLAYGLTRWRDRWRWVKWGTVGLMTGLMLLNTYPIGGALGTSITKFLAPNVGHRAYMGPEFPHTQIISEILKTEPHLQSNLAVLPSTPEIDQHNFDYYGALRDFQVYARQIGTQMKFVPQDVRSLSWFLTKTDSQGTYASQMQAPQAAFAQAVETSPDLRVQRSWTLPDGSTLNLHHRRSSPVEVIPLASASPAKVRLDRVTLPAKVPPGAPVPVTYEWSGPWNQLQSGIVVLTWWTDFSTPISDLGFDSTSESASPPESTSTPPELTPEPALSPRQLTSLSPRATTTNHYWIHDHGLGLGALHSGQLQPGQSRAFRVIERTAMLPPNGTSAASYKLSARYLNRETGESYAIAVPPTVRVAIEPAAKPVPAPELDWVTQLRTLATTLPQGRKALDPIFDKVGQMNLYDPVQDYLVQAQKALEYRLKTEPQNVDFAYGVALSQVLQRHVAGAIVALERVAKLDAKNPYAYAYLAFVNLADLRPGAAQKALKPALASHPNVPELKALNAIAALMRGNLVQAWQESRGLNLN